MLRLPRPLGPPFVSVIVPVYRADGRLGTCLGALETQSYPGGAYEVVVVDNDPARSGIAALVDAYPHARCVPCARPGAYAARNVGIAVSKGTILAFTDIDCEPAPGWIEEGVAALAGADRVVGGAIEVDVADRARPSALELHDVVFGFPQQRYVEEEGFAVTANLFTTRAVLERVGPFDETLLSAGDHAWSARARSHGVPLAYSPRAVVRHPARGTWREQGARMLRGVGGQLDAGLSHSRGLGREIRPRRGALRELRRAPAVRGPVDVVRVLAAAAGIKSMRLAVRLMFAAGIRRRWR